MSLLNQVSDTIFIGNFAAACNLKLLTQTGITHILTVAAGLAPRFPGQFIYMQFPALDLIEYNILQHFSESFDFIQTAESARGKVLVHCAMGMSRSATIVLAYLMRSRHWRFDRARKYLMVKHPDGRPNPGFTQQLKRYEEMIRDYKEVEGKTWCACHLM